MFIGARERFYITSSYVGNPGYGPDKLAFVESLERWGWRYLLPSWMFKRNPGDMHLIVPYIICAHWSMSLLDGDSIYYLDSTGSHIESVDKEFAILL